MSSQRRRVLWLGQGAVALEGDEDLIELTRFVYPTTPAAVPEPSMTVTLSREDGAVHARCASFMLRDPDEAQLAERLDHALSEYAVRTTATPSLHAALLGRGDRGLLLMGKHAAGKSTLAFALSQSSAALLSDDICRVWADPLRVEGLPRAARIRPAAVAALQAQAPGLLANAHVAPSGLRRVAVSAPTQALQPVACVCVEFAEGKPTSLEQMTELSFAGECLSALFKDQVAARARLSVVAALVRGTRAFRFVYGGAPQAGAEGLLRLLAEAAIPF